MCGKRIKLKNITIIFLFSGYATTIFYIDDSYLQMQMTFPFSISLLSLPFSYFIKLLDYKRTRKIMSGISKLIKLN